MYESKIFNILTVEDCRKRNQIIDLVKGIGIVLMVVRHAQAPYSDFVLLFHMAVFFIASGYLYNEKHAESLETVVKLILKKLKNLYLPFFLYSVAFILLNNIFLICNIYTNDPRFLSAEGLDPRYVKLGSFYNIQALSKHIIKAALFQSETQMGGALWFLQVLFCVVVGYTVIEYITRRYIKDHKKQALSQLIISVAFMLVGYCCQLEGWHLYGMNRICTVYILIHIGRIIKEKDIMGLAFSRCNRFFFIAASMLILLLGYHRGTIALVNNEIENPVFFIVMSLAGWVLLYSIAELIARYSILVSNCLSYISRHSIPIIALHFLCFKIVNYAAVILLHKERYMVAAFPVLMSDGAWWILYTAVGIGFPLALRAIAVCISKYNVF